MSALYVVGQANDLLVAGKRTKVKYFGVGFYTKYRDGEVDISPIADLTKTDGFSIAMAIGSRKYFQFINVSILRTNIKWFQYPFVKYLKA